MAACSSWASAARPATPRTPSTTSASSATSRPTRRPTTCASSPPAPTTRAGTPRSRSGSRARRLCDRDALLVFSVGGGNASEGCFGQPGRRARAGPRARHLDLRRSWGATAAHRPVADACIVVPPLYADRITPHTEGLCAVLWHLLVTPSGVGRVQRPDGKSCDEPASHPARYCIVGGAGFIGSHFVDRLLASDGSKSVTVFDNFSSGRALAPRAPRPTPGSRWSKVDVRDLEDLVGRHGRARHRHPPGVEPRHRPGGDRSGGRLRPGNAAHPPRGGGGPPSAASSWCSTPRAAASTATWASARPTRTTAR